MTCSRLRAISPKVHPDKADDATREAANQAFGKLEKASQAVEACLEDKDACMEVQSPPGAANSSRRVLGPDVR